MPDYSYMGLETPSSSMPPQPIEPSPPLSAKMEGNKTGFAAFREALAAAPPDEQERIILARKKEVFNEHFGGVSPFVAPTPGRGDLLSMAAESITFLTNNRGTLIRTIPERFAASMQVDCEVVAADALEIAGRFRKFASAARGLILKK